MNYFYEYQCSCPYGTPCPWCKENNLSEIIESFKYSRGQTYYGNLKALLNIQGQKIAQEALRIKEETGKLSLRDLLIIADKFNFPRNRMKALIEWLEECEILRVGTYKRLSEAKEWKPTKIVVN